MAKSLRDQHFSNTLNFLLINPNLSRTTFPLQKITIHLSFCMHLGIYLSYPGLQYEQNLTTGIRVMTEKPTSNHQKC